MKNFRSILSVLALVVFSACNGESEAVIGQYTTIEVDPVYDGGTVAKGEIVRAEIKIKNTGDYPLVLAEVKGACSCTVSEFSKDPVAPGESTIIRAEVDTDKTGKGLINKSVTIMANTRPARTQVTVQAKVID